jgi:hypothetical protein
MRGLHAWQGLGTDTVQSRRISATRSRLLIVAASAGQGAVMPLRGVLRRKKLSISCTLPPVQVEAGVAEQRIGDAAQIADQQPNVARLGRSQGGSVNKL